MHAAEKKRGPAAQLTAPCCWSQNFMRARCGDSNGIMRRSAASASPYFFPFCTWVALARRTTPLQNERMRVRFFSHCSTDYLKNYNFWMREQNTGIFKINSSTDNAHNTSIPLYTIYRSTRSFHLMLAIKKTSTTHHHTPTLLH